MVSLYTCSWWKVSERLHRRCHDCCMVLKLIGQNRELICNTMLHTFVVHYINDKAWRQESYRGKSKQFCNDCIEAPKPLLSFHEFF